VQQHPLDYTRPDELRKVRYPRVARAES
jgi:hypothetical protein